MIKTSVKGVKTGDKAGSNVPTSSGIRNYGMYGKHDTGTIAPAKVKAPASNPKAFGKQSGGSVIKTTGGVR